MVEELKKLNQWVCWKYIDKGDGKKPTKLPVNAHTGRAAETDNPATWAGYSLASAAVEKFNCAGIGFVFSCEDGFCGIDLDACIVDGVIADWALTWMKKFNSYCEVSPSGTGVKIFCRGKLPGDGRKSGNREIYDRGRYFTFTGNAVEGFPTSCELRQLEVDEFYSQFPVVAVKKEKVALPMVDDEVNYTGVKEKVDLTADDLMVIKKLKEDRLFASLWSGDLTSYGNDHSECDMALAGRLVFLCGKNPERVDRLFRHSGLMRGKWDEYRGSVTYGERTVGIAIENAVVVHPVEKFVGSPVNTGRRKVAFPAAHFFNSPKINWQINRHFASNSLIALVGVSGIGKSFLALDYSMCIATGKPYLGIYDVKKGVVLYVASEGSTGLHTRMQAWMTFRGVKDIPSDLFFATCSFDLMTADGAGEIMKIVEEDLKCHPSLIVIDTLARNYGMGNENAAQDMGQVIKIADFLRDQFGSTILFLHHAGHNEKRPRGSTALLGASDTLLMLENNGDSSIKVRCAKQKDYEPFTSYILHAKKIEHFAEDGADCSSLVFHEPSNSVKAFNQLHTNHKKLLKELVNKFQGREFTAANAIDAGLVKKTVSYTVLPELADKELLHRIEREKVAHYTVATAVCELLLKG